MQDACLGTRLPISIHRLYPAERNAGAIFLECGPGTVPFSLASNGETISTDRPAVRS